MFGLRPYRFLNVCELTVESAVVNITDLATLELLAQEPSEQATNPLGVTKHTNRERADWPVFSVPSNKHSSYKLAVVP